MTTPPPTTSSSSGSTTSDTEGSSSTTETTGGGSESTALPETTSTSSTTDETASTTADTSGESTDTTGALQCAGDSPSPFVEACCAMSELYDECFGYAIPPGYCEMYEAYIGMYGEECVDAQADLWACLSLLECDAFGEDAVPAECLDVALEANAACPELIPLCSSGSGGEGMGFCEVEAMDCLDGHTYTVTCTAGICTCSIDDADVGNFAGDEGSCFAPGFDDAVVNNCGFPAGLFG
jgi:hypothetical protein